MTRARRYLGLISGTSADGIDAAIVRVTEAQRPRVEHAATFAFEPALRDAVLRLIRDGHTALDALGRTDAALGAAFAAAALRLLARSGVARDTVRAIGSHGQTIRHAPGGTPPFTLQIGDPSVIATRTGLPVVADLRRADVALGGQGAPLVPPFHAAAFADTREPRVVVNLGGIANLTVLRAGAAGVLDGDPKAPPVTGFDSGPASALCDAWIARHEGRAWDEDGAWARSGTVHEALLSRLLAEPYLAAPPPKSTGKELYNLDYLDRHLAASGEPIAPRDVQATLVELTARSVAAAVTAHGAGARRVLVCGGGVHNGYLVERLQRSLPEAAVESTAAHGIDPDFVEAAAFGWLACRRLEGRTVTLASVTGASRDSTGGGLYLPD